MITDYKRIYCILGVANKPGDPIHGTIHGYVGSADSRYPRTQWLSLLCDYDAQHFKDILVTRAKCYYPQGLRPAFYVCRVNKERKLLFDVQLDWSTLIGWQDELVTLRKDGILRGISKLRFACPRNAHLPHGTNSCDIYV